jgi:hypothetical protein
MVAFHLSFSPWKPHIAKPNNVTNQYLIHCQFWAVRRILRTLGRFNWVLPRREPLLVYFLNFFTLIYCAVLRN